MIDYINIKETPKNKGILLDSCNREDRMYYNGVYYDLCGMSVKNYINSTLLNCDGINIGGGNGSITPPTGGGDNNDGGIITPPTGGGDINQPVLLLNAVIFSYAENNKLTVMTNKPPYNDITVTFNYDNQEHVVTIPKNNDSYILTDITINDNITNSLDNVTISPLTDSIYKYGSYTIDDLVLPGEHFIYYGMVNTQTYNNIDSSYVVDKLNGEILNNIEKSISFIVPGTDANTDDMSDEEYEMWEENNAYFKILVIPSELYNIDGTIKFKFLFNGSDAFIGYNNVKTLNINNIEHILLVDNDDSDKFINSDKEPLLVATYNIIL